MRNYNSQLKSLATGVAIAIAGGAVLVATAGGTSKASLFDANGAAITNPVPLVNGSFDFNVADSVASVDLYIVSPTGHMTVLKSVKSSGDSSIFVDTSQKEDVIIVPFDVADQAGDNTETDTGFDLPTNTVIQAGVTLDVITADATETVDVGTLTGETGADPNGIIAAASVATAATIGSTTVGIAGLVIADAVSLSYTLSAGADTAAGFAKIPVQLPVASL